MDACLVGSTELLTAVSKADYSAAKWGIRTAEHWVGSLVVVKANKWAVHLELPMVVMMDI